MKKEFRYNTVGLVVMGIIFLFASLLVLANGYYLGLYEDFIGNTYFEPGVESVIVMLIGLAAVIGSIMLLKFYIDIGELGLVIKEDDDKLIFRGKNYRISEINQFKMQGIFMILYIDGRKIYVPKMFIKVKHSFGDKKSLIELLKSFAD
ncbi:hypothetical protein RJG79_10820 [Mycoplasmatota bacterium WC44]